MTGRAKNEGGGSASRRPLTAAEKVTAAVERRDAAIAKASAAAHASFRKVVRAAHEDGLSAVEIARAAGLTRQRVYQLLEPTDAELEARVADIDRRWDATVERFSEQWHSASYERVEQAKKNGRAKKRARKGLPPATTIRVERLRYAETLMLQAIGSEPDNPVFVDVRRQLADRDRLATQLERRRDRRSGIFS